MAISKSKSRPSEWRDVLAPEVIGQFKGRHIAILNKKVVAVGRTYRDLREKVDHYFPNETPYLAYIPGDPAERLQITPNEIESAPHLPELITSSSDESSIPEDEEQENEASEIDHASNTDFDFASEFDISALEQSLADLASTETPKFHDDVSALVAETLQLIESDETLTSSNGSSSNRNLGPELDLSHLGELPSPQQQVDAHNQEESFSTEIPASDSHDSTSDENAYQNNHENVTHESAIREPVTESQVTKSIDIPSVELATPLTIEETEPVKPKRRLIKARVIYYPTDEEGHEDFSQ